jgi:hypothetical protein
MDTIDQGRRRALTCMLWAGTGALWTVAGGVPRSSLLVGSAQAATTDERDLTFMQISDSHIGFKNPPNADTPGTLHEAIDRVAALKGNASLLIHTGDVSHLSRADQFDTAEQIIKGAGLEFDGRLDFAPPVRDFAAEGFPLIGGRLDYLDGRTVAALAYRRDKHIIDVYVWPGSGTPALGDGAHNGYNVAHWTQDGMVFWAVSDVEAAQLAAFVRLWRGTT